MRTRRCIDPTELLAICEPHEPEAVLLAAAASGDLRRQAKIWIAELPDGEPAGVAGCIRVCFDRWYGASLLLDERGAEPLARVLDRSPAWRIWGAARHVEPLCSWLTRVRHIHEQQGGSFSPGLDEMSNPDDRVRLATLDDLDALLELYRGFELNLVPTARRLRRYLRARVARGEVLVVPLDGRLVAAEYAEAISRQYIFWSGLTVLPEYRTQWLSWALAQHVWIASARRGTGGCWTVSASSHFSYLSAGSRWLDVRLEPPRHFRGQNRLRGLLERFEGRLERRTASPVSGPGDGRRGLRR